MRRWARDWFRCKSEGRKVVVVIVVLFALLVGALGVLLAGCGSMPDGDSTRSNAARSSESGIVRIVGEEVKQHIENLNHGQADIRSVACKERGPVPSMGRNAVAFLCTFDGETDHAELWAELPMDHEEPVMLLDVAAEQELAARGEYAGLKDGGSEASNKAAEEDIHHSEKEVQGELNDKAAPSTTSSEDAESNREEAHQ